MQQVIDLVNVTAAIGKDSLKTILDLASVFVPQEKAGGTMKSAEKGIEKVVQKPMGPNGSPFNRNFVRIAGLSGALAVALGAYGSHVIEMSDKVDDERKRSFRSANLYHFIGTFGLIASSLAKYPSVSGGLMAAGTLVFCGSCYVYAVSGDAAYKKYAPYGGTTLIVAWLSLVL